MTIKPALTKEEWAECVEIERSGHDPLTYGILAPAAKAICWINGNLSDSDPQKFTREDVELLAWLLRNSRNQADIVIDDWLDEAKTARLRSLKDHIEALLPPSPEQNT